MREVMGGYYNYVATQAGAACIITYFDATAACAHTTGSYLVAQIVSHDSEALQAMLSAREHEFSVCNASCKRCLAAIWLQILIKSSRYHQPSGYTSFLTAVPAGTSWWVYKPHIIYIYIFTYICRFHKRFRDMHSQLRTYMGVICA